MGQSVYRNGVVIDGDYKGKSIYKGDDKSYIIVSNDENGKIIIKSLFPTHFSVLKEITKETVDHYVEISNVQGKTYDLALYFKSGEKSLIRLNSAGHRDLASILFVL